METVPFNIYNMNCRSISLSVCLVLSMFSGCKQESKTDNETRVPTTTPDKPSDMELLPSTKRVFPPPQPLEQIFSCTALDVELSRVSSIRVWPPVAEVEEAFREGLRKVLERRKELLLSVPVSPKAEKHRNEAWKELEFKEGMGIFVLEQYHYAEALLKSYATAPRIEQLVIWDLIRLRMKYKVIPGGRVGLSGTPDILLRREMARLLFAALGVDKSELFDASELKAMAASSEATSRGSRAEGEIERLHLELEKEAEKILEEHWKPG
jgi:hypothetical protein